MHAFWQLTCEVVPMWKLTHILNAELSAHILN